MSQVTQAQLAAWLPEVVQIAEAAGRAIMEVYRKEVRVSYKQDQSPLTEADLAAHRIIERGLQTLTPQIPVLSEESAGIAYAERQGWQSFWLVDPLDGTKEFIDRNGEFTVNIALIVVGEPRLGVVRAPALGATYYAARGAGAFRADASGAARLAVAAHQAGEPWRVVASRSHADERTVQFLSRFENCEIVSKGSSLKFCLVAEGSAHLYPRLGPTMEWDIAAGHCVVAEAGGAVHGLDGAPLAYNKADLHNPFFIVACPTAEVFLELPHPRLLSRGGGGDI
ncbi:MAG: 3'(2'),5'-bisphosphate nucleotidase CysQ [Pseudomonadota bacterium]